jgi:hypothetical protein
MKKESKQFTVPNTFRKDKTHFYPTNSLLIPFSKGGYMAPILPSPMANPDTKIFRDTTALPFAYGGNMYPDGGQLVVKSNKPYFSYGDSPNKYVKNSKGEWAISNESTGFKYVPIKDPTGKRTAELNKNAKYNSAPEREHSLEFWHLQDLENQKNPLQNNNMPVAESTSVKNNYSPNVSIKVYKANDKVKNYYKEYHQSPRYKEMLSKSLDPNNVFDQDILSGREKNLIGPKVYYKNTQPSDNPRTGGYSNTTTGDITVLPKGQNVKGLLPHEWSHSIDRPTVGSTRLIPAKDRQWISEHRSTNWYNSPQFLNQNLETQKQDIKYKNNPGFTNFLKAKKEWYNYVGEPTETRARLNDIRYQAKQKKVYDPFTEKVNTDVYQKLLKIKFETGDKEGFDALQQLKEVYTDEEILYMLNTISQNSSVENEGNVNIAAYGGTLYGNGGMLKRADGSYSKKGLWDNIRANAGSGKAPTKQMLAQERKISREHAYGGSLEGGRKTNLPEDNFMKGGRNIYDSVYASSLGDYYEEGGYLDNQVPVQNTNLGVLTASELASRLNRLV